MAGMASQSQEREGMMHLRYCYQTALFESKENRHAQKVMRELGISYSHSTPQSLGDQWWFWNCKNVPSPLPAYLSELRLDPHESIGYGLSKEDADEIVAESESGRG